MKIIAFASLLLAICIVSPAKADDGALKTTLEGQYAAMKSAIADRDSKAILALLAPSFASIDVSGHGTTAPEMIQELEATPKDPLKTSTTTLVSINTQGDKAIVQQDYDMKTVKTAPDGAKKNVELKSRSTDTWVNSNGAWLLEKTITDQMDYFVDGQSVFHRARSGGP